MAFDAPSLTWAAALLLGTTIFVYGLRSRRVRSKLPLPPGPKKLPLLGNILDIPSARPWEQYMAWSKEYNTDILHLDLAGTSLIVLSSLKATEDLMDKRSSIYSDRARLPMIVELVGWDFNVALMRYGDQWRTHRRLFNQRFIPKAAEKYRPQQVLATHRLLRRLQQTPDDFVDHFKHWAAQIIMSTAYGIDVKQQDDPYVAIAHDAIHSSSEAAVFGRFLVDAIPWLKHVPAWLPGAGFKRQARAWRPIVRKMADVPFAETKRQMDLGIAPASFAAESLQRLRDGEDTYYTEDTVRATAATMFIGGADTSVSALQIFVLAMLANPEAQRRAQAEVDAVTGGQQLPEYPDEAAMPYVAAVVKEVMRWRNVLPIALPHNLMAEDEYRGYRIPAGSIIIGNTWAILHDEVTYPDPYSFKPERWLLDGKLNPAVQSPDAAFGYGRRFCPGRHTASASVWIAVASMLATLNITKAKDEHGAEIEPTYEFDEGIISAPLPFQCCISPRTHSAAELIRRTAQDEMPSSG
ncbi:cytochrome P450 [Mycena belliarum]|uniref:Cytochrome P450 n=1 Tax=Mycena belliarum TaxID=1033014 RepID=A0AAD6UFA7_9AGAR|nr:cytochrome P450 [Mycena belliae]